MTYLSQLLQCNALISVCQVIKVVMTMTMIIKIILDLIPDNNAVLTTISAGSPEAEIAKHKKHGLALEGTLRSGCSLYSSFFHIIQR